jgi:hypothetical protein
MPDEERGGDRLYTMRQALHDARDMLEKEFGDVDQEAAVLLANLLHGVKLRDDYLRTRDAENEMPYGGMPGP